METVVTIFFSMIEVVSSLLISGSFFKKRKYGNILVFPITMIIILTFILLWSFTPIKDILYLKLPIVFTMYILITQITYQGNFVAKIAITIIEFVLFYTIDIIAVGITMQIFNISYSNILSFNKLNIFVSMLSKLISLSISIIINKIYSNRKKSLHFSIYEWIRILLYPAVTFLVLMVFIESVLSENDASPLMIITVMALVRSNIVIFYVMNKLDYEKQIEEEYTILQHKIKTEMSNVTALMDAYSQQRKLTHDFAGHLSAIRSLFFQNEIPRLQEYISNLCNQLNTAILPVRTNNLIIDAILNQKYAIANKNNIQMDFQFNDLSDFPMKDEDIVIVLTNALDNAIEACNRVDSNKVIQVKIISNSSYAIISIRNTYKPNENVTKGIEHGFGIKNMKGALKKYNTNLIVAEMSDWFQVTARIPKL